MAGRRTLPYLRMADTWGGGAGMAVGGVEAAVHTHEEGNANAPVNWSDGSLGMAIPSARGVVRGSGNLADTGLARCAAIKYGTLNSAACPPPPC